MSFLIVSDLTEKQSQEIISFYRSFDIVSIEQYPGFARVNDARESFHYIQRDEKGQITAYAQVLFRKFLIATVSFGPLAISGDAYRDALIHIKKYCSQKPILALRVSPPYFVADYGVQYYNELREQLHFETSDREINWATLVLSTEGSEEAILKKFADNHRQSVKKALKMGLEVEVVSDPAQIDIFSAQHSEMYERRGLQTDKEANRVHFTKLFDFFQQTGLGYFIVVKEGPNIIGGVCCVIQGNAARYQEGYSHPDYRKFPISHLALYKAILIAKEKGLGMFDFGGYAKNVAEGDQLYAINKFKAAFNGDLLVYPDTFLIYTTPFSGFLYKLYQRIKKK